MLKGRRQKRDLHALDEEGMVLCNPRDREAAHRYRCNKGELTHANEDPICRAFCLGDCRLQE